MAEERECLIPPDGRQRADRAVMLLIGIGLLAFYLAIQRGQWVSWDGRVMAGIARNIWQHARFERFRDSFGGDPNYLHGSHFAPFGIGLSLLMAPTWALQLHRDPNGAFWLTTLNPVLTAVTGVVLYGIGLDLGLRRLSSALAALAFGLLTMAPMYSTELFSEPGVTLSIVVAVAGLIGWGKNRPSGPWLLGLGIAWAILFRYDSLVLVAPLVCAAPFFVPLERLRTTWRVWLPAVALPVGSAIGWTLYYNNLRYGGVLDFGENQGMFTAPILHGIERQLLSPGKGFFWYSPILLAALPGLLWLWRRNRAVAAVLIALSVARVLLFAGYWNPDGGIAWGPRYLLPACALLALGLGETFEHVASARRARGAAMIALVALMAASAVVVVASVWVPYEHTWSVANDIPNWRQMPVQQLDALKEQHVNRQFDDPYWSPIALNLRDLAHARPFPLYWFGGGPSVQGIGFLALAAAAAGGAVAAARRTDRRLGDHPRARVQRGKD